jgi:hypothetical protein
MPRGVYHHKPHPPGRRYPRKDPVTLFLKHVTPRGRNECWLWQGSLTNGYGVFCLNGKTMTAHRAAYLLFVDHLLPPYLDVHHRCDVYRSCVNWHHLQPATRQYHLADLSPTNRAYQNKRKTHCLRGHEYTAENTGHHKNGGRFCKTCRRASALQHRDTRNARRRAARIASAPCSHAP